MKTNEQSPFLKALFVGLLSLILLVPLLFVNFLVGERSQRKADVVQEISNQWSRRQVISSLKIKIPTRTKKPSIAESTGEKATYVNGFIFWSPAKQEIKGVVKPLVKKKGIYQAVLYDAELQIEGYFESFERVNSFTEYDFENAEVIFEVSDFRGLKGKVEVLFNGQRLQMQNATNRYISQKLPKWNPFKKENKYALQLEMKGSSQLAFYPSAAATLVSLQSTWQDPGFFGAFLPNHNIDKNGFSASWRVLELNRSLPQVSHTLTSLSALNPNEYKDEILLGSQEEYLFGVSLVEVTNNYQKNERASKYGILIIGLTFMAFYFIEVFLRKKVNLIQYLLIGLALVIFYTLLLSLSEFLAFDTAFSMASIMTISLVVLFSKSLFNAWRPAFMVGGVLAVLYGFIFTIIQLEDTALLVGSLGLFMILAITMYFSRIIQWRQNE